MMVSKANKQSTSQVRGVPKSGRRWKIVRSRRNSSMKKGPAFNCSWEKKMTAKAEMKAVKEYQNKLNENRRQEKINEKNRLEEKRKRKEENQRKSEVVQVIRNTAKLKRMTKKQLKSVRKADTSDVETKKMLP